MANPVFNVKAGRWQLNGKFVKAPAQAPQLAPAGAVIQVGYTRADLDRACAVAIDRALETRRERTRLIFATAALVVAPFAGLAYLLS